MHTRPPQHTVGSPRVQHPVLVRIHEGMQAALSHTAHLVLVSYKQPALNVSLGREAAGNRGAIAAVERGCV